MRSVIGSVFFAAVSVFVFPRFCLAANPTWCRTAELSVRPLRAGASAGTIIQMFAISNRTSTSCFLGGFPSLQALDSNKKPLPHAVFHRVTGILPREPQPQIRARFLLEPGREMWFELIFSDEAPYRGDIEDRSSCHKIDKLLVLPPHNKNAMIVNYSGRVCDLLRYTPLFLPVPGW
jgi:hypothetical protein